MAFNLNDMTGQPHDDVVTLDEITGSFRTRTQRQDYYEPKPAETDDSIPTELLDPEGEAAAEASEGVWSPNGNEPAHEVSPERYQRTGLRIAKAIDTGFNFVASNFIAAGSDKDYKADKDDLADLGEAWGELAQEKQWEVSPVWQVLILTAMVYIPLTKEAFNDRRLLELERKQQEQEDKQKLMAEEIKALQNELYRRNQNDVDFAAVGHGFTTIPPIFFTYATHFCVFATSDNVGRRKNVVLNFPALEKAVQHVNQTALKDPHYCVIIKNE